MAELNHDWTKFSLRIYVKAGLEEVFDAWTTADGLARWFLRRVTFTSPGGTEAESHERANLGDTYAWEWHVSGYVMQGRVLQLEAPHQLAFTFDGAERVIVSLSEEDEETRIDLTQEGMSEEEQARSIYVGCYGGWTFYLANLKSVLEGGMDLRNRTTGRMGVVNM